MQIILGYTASLKTQLVLKLLRILSISICKAPEICVSEKLIRGRCLLRKHVRKTRKINKRKIQRPLYRFMLGRAGDKKENEELCFR